MTWVLIVLFIGGAIAVGWFLTPALWLIALVAVGLLVLVVVWAMCAAAAEGDSQIVDDFDEDEALAEGRFARGERLPL